MIQEESLKKKAVKRLGILRQERQSFIPQYQELSDYILPRGFRKQVADRNRGEKKGQSIIDNTASVALRTLGSGMMAGLTSPARPWFRLATSDAKVMAKASVKSWLSEVENRMREVFVRSNLYQILPVAYESLGCFGTACLLELEDDEDVVRFYHLPCGSYMIASSYRQSVDTIYREFSMTVKQLVDEFGIENVSEKIKISYEAGTYDTWIDVVHIIEPNRDREAGKIDNKNKPFNSIYFEVAGEGDKLLRHTGFEEFCGMAPRWAITGEDIYGSSPAMMCLGDIKALQMEQAQKLQAIEKMVNPAMLADAVLKTTRLSVLPGDVTYINGLANTQHAGMRPVYEVNPRIAELEQDIQAIQYRIRRAMFEDMMQMFAISGGSQMTAREVEERHSEKLLVLGPVMERLNEELLDPIIDRTFAIMLRKGMIPPPPPELSEESLRVEYISVMAAAQKLIGTASIERLVSFVGNLAGANPAVLDKIDFDVAIDEYAMMLGTSPEVVIPNEKVAVSRAAKAKAAQGQQMMANMPAMAQGADALKTLSETGMGESNALNRLLGG